MRIAVIGAGALGLYYGAKLHRAGQDVHFLLRRDFQVISRDGLSVTSPEGDFRLADIKGYQNAQEIGPVDLVLIGIKTFANHRLVDLVKPLIGKNTALLTLQNGLGNEELLADAFGAARVLGGIAFLCSNRGEPGTVHHLGEGRIRLGEFEKGLTERAVSLATLFNDAGVPCEAVADLRKARWEKLVWNIPFNGLCALTGKDVTELLAHALTRTEILSIMQEVITAANRQELTSPIEAENFISRMITATEGMQGYRPSMMIDRMEGRPLELTAIYGTPLRAAEEKGAEMPRVGMLRALLDLGEHSRQSDDVQ